MNNETIFYVKKGRRYVPHSTYSSEFCDSFPKGTHLVQSYPGGSLRRFNIDPAYAPMIAAGRVAEEKISEVLMKANELRPQTTPITPAAQRAWQKLKKELGNEAMLTRGSAREAAEAAVNAMAVEAEKLLENPAVRKAYERFLFVAELTKDHNGTSTL
jgi:hypothetical protein